MHMASRMNIGSSLVYRRMNDESRRIDRLICTTDSVPFLVHADHIRDLQKGEVYSVRVDPESAGLDGIFRLSELASDGSMLMISDNKTYLEH